MEDSSFFDRLHTGEIKNAKDKATEVWNTYAGSPAIDILEKLKHELGDAELVFELFTPYADEVEPVFTKPSLDDLFFIENTSLDILPFGRRRNPYVRGSVVYDFTFGKKQGVVEKWKGYGIQMTRNKDLQVFSFSQNNGLVGFSPAKHLSYKEWSMHRPMVERTVRSLQERPLVERTLIDFLGDEKS